MSRLRPITLRRLREPLTFACSALRLHKSVNGASPTRSENEYQRNGLPALRQTHLLRAGANHRLRTVRTLSKLQPGTRGRAWTRSSNEDRNDWRRRKEVATYCLYRTGRLAELCNFQGKDCEKKSEKIFGELKRPLLPRQAM